MPAEAVGNRKEVEAGIRIAAHENGILVVLAGWGPGPSARRRGPGTLATASAGVADSVPERAASRRDYRAAPPATYGHPVPSEEARRWRRAQLPGR